MPKPYMTGSVVLTPIGGISSHPIRFAGLQRYSTAVWSGDIGTRLGRHESQISAD
jgi:hypothetical protein